MKSLLSLPLAAVVAVSRVEAQADLPSMPRTEREGLLARFDEASRKITQLAELIPADKYGWRPTREVRRVSEILVHLGMANYYTLEGAGQKSPIKLKEDEETRITAKPDVIGFLEQSNRYMRETLRRLKDSDLARSTTMFDQKTTVGNALMFGVTHLHEHLGQLVSYARLNGLPPPWSAKS
jgi:uncharacterized damage-inducible protein DinB